MLRRLTALTRTNRPYQAEPRQTESRVNTNRAAARATAGSDDSRNINHRHNQHSTSGTNEDAARAARVRDRLHTQFSHQQSTESSSSSPSPTPVDTDTGHTTKKLNYLKLVDSLSLGKSRRTPEEINSMVDMAKSLTRPKNTHDGTVGLRTLDPRAFEYCIDTHFDREKNTLLIGQSFRILNPDCDESIPYASDSYNAHLSILGLTSAMPKHILIDDIINTVTESQAEELREKYPVDNLGKIKIQLNRRDPNDRANADLCKLLTETVTGKSTVNAVKDFNILRRTKHTIESAEISFNPLTIDFTIGKKRWSFYR